MKFCNLLLVCLVNLVLSTGLFAQNLFTEKTNIRYTPDYCMDCGSPKATITPFMLDYISTRINHRFNFAGGGGSISFQVVVDHNGFSCVVSHSDVTHSQLTAELMRYLNGCQWHPAIENGKPTAASVNVTFTIANGRISGKMERMDLSELTSPGKPTIYNTQYHYSNSSLNNYNFTVWTKYNSPLPGNIGLAALVDKSDLLWYSTSRGMARFDGETFTAVTEANSPLTATTVVNDMAIDKDKNIWMYANRSIYTYNAGWKMFDSTHVGISGGYRIITNPSGEVFFTNRKGLLIVRGEKIRLVDKTAFPQMPSNNVYYAYYDSRGRLWIGTFGGSMMVDKNEKVTVFNNTGNPLSNMCISNMTEDEQGNLYFSLNSLKNTPGDVDEEGIAVMKTDGTWIHYNDKNSGMPSNHVNSLFYDKFEHVLWIGTHLSGLVRFDLKNDWENYNNANSAIPGFDIYQIAQDSKGTIYAATANGLLRIMKK